MTCLRHGSKASFVFVFSLYRLPPLACGCNEHVYCLILVHLGVYFDKTNIWLCVPWSTDVRTCFRGSENPVKVASLQWLCTGCNEFQYNNGSVCIQEFHDCSSNVIMSSVIGIVCCSGSAGFSAQKVLAAGGWRLATFLQCFLIADRTNTFTMIFSTWGQTWPLAVQHACGFSRRVKAVKAAWSSDTEGAFTDQGPVIHTVTPLKVRDLCETNSAEPGQLIHSEHG